MSINNSGYVYSHHGLKPEHIVVAERVVGHTLPSGAEVHHVDGDKKNNIPSNLVICPNRAYHSLLHVRERALDTCGDANKRKCQFCKQYDLLENLIGSGRKNKANEYSAFRHRACQSAYIKARGWPNRPNHYLKREAK